MINVTIHDTYVPYTDWCLPHAVSVYEGHNITVKHLIESFCGHVLAETVYTKKHLALLQLHVNKTIPPAAIKILVSYQTHIQGYAYRFNGTSWNCTVPRTWKLKMYTQKTRYSASGVLIPSWVSFTYKHIKFVWYIVNSIQPDYSNRRIRHINACQLTIRQFICKSRLSALSIQPGLLPLSWLDTKSDDQHMVHCNLTEESVVDTKLYRYISLVLNMYSLDPFITFDVTFLPTVFRPENVNSEACRDNICEVALDMTSNGVYTKDVLMQNSQMWQTISALKDPAKKGHLESDRTFFIKFHYFHSIGLRSNIPHNKVLTLDKRSKHENFPKGMIFIYLIISVKLNCVKYK
jgi:hypothetical protein